MATTNSGTTSKHATVGVKPDLASSFDLVSNLTNTTVYTGSTADANAETSTNLPLTAGITSDPAEINTEIESYISSNEDSPDISTTDVDGTSVETTFKMLNTDIAFAGETNDVTPTGVTVELTTQNFTSPSIDFFETIPDGSLSNSFDHQNQIKLKMANQDFPCPSNYADGGCWRIENVGGEEKCVFVEDSKCISLQCTPNHMQGLINWRYFNFSDENGSLRDRFLSGENVLSVGNSSRPDCQLNYDSELDGFEFQFVLGECNMEMVRKSDDNSSSNIVFEQTMSFGDQNVKFECIYPATTVTNSIESALDHQNDPKISHGFSQKSDWGPQFDVLYFADQDFESAHIRHGQCDERVRMSNYPYFGTNYSPFREGPSPVSNRPKKRF